MSDFDTTADSRVQYPEGAAGGASDGPHFDQLQAIQENSPSQKDMKLLGERDPGAAVVEEGVKPVEGINFLARDLARTPGVNTDVDDDEEVIARHAEGTDDAAVRRHRSPADTPAVLTNERGVDQIDTVDEVDIVGAVVEDRSTISEADSNVHSDAGTDAPEAVNPDLTAEEISEADAEEAIESGAAEPAEPYEGE